MLQVIFNVIDPLTQKTTLAHRNASACRHGLCPWGSIEQSP
jgi:hypothetical protein